MSLANDNSRGPVTGRKTKKTHTHEKSKKRKRHVQDESDPPPTVKKHKSKSHAPTPELQDTPPPLDVSPPEARSPFHQQTASLYLPLPPIAQSHPLQGICAEHISPLILTYYSPLRGVIISFQNARLSTDGLQDSSGQDEPVLAQAIDEYAAPHIWVVVDFLLFKPQRGNAIEGWINLQNEGNIGLVCWNFFNATIERKRLPKNWKWIPGGLDLGGAKRKRKKLKGSERGDPLTLDHEELLPQINGVHDIEGHFEDGDGRRIQGLMQFRVKDVESSRSSGGDTGFLSIEGTLLGEAEERKLRESEIKYELSRSTKHGRRYHAADAVSGSSGIEGGERHANVDRLEKSQRNSVH
ncbi:MAG: hypothetical protein Q9168_004232 [Polycauliona sp. 1 TL-2023]